MAVELVKADGQWTLRLSGVVDIFDASAMHAAALEMVASGERGLIALGEAEAVDTAATQVLVALKRALSAHGRRLELGAVPGPVRELWTLAGLDAELR
jgi:ABC-type transporter Mla MlaB component